MGHDRSPRRQAGNDDDSDSVNDRAVANERPPRCLRRRGSALPSKSPQQANHYLDNLLAQEEGRDKQHRWLDVAQ